MRFGKVKQQALMLIHEFQSRKLLNRMLTSISGLIPPLLVYPSSTCHPKGISTETTASLLAESSMTLNETSVWIRSSKVDLGVPE